jgi:hypothetical protein
VLYATGHGQITAMQYNDQARDRVAERIYDGLRAKRVVLRRRWTG